MNNAVPRRKFWPYDEVTASRDPQFKNRFIISAPWLTFQFDVADDDLERADIITKKVSEKNLAAEDLSDLNWLFSSLSSYPFSYILPQASRAASDHHAKSVTKLNLANPRSLLTEMSPNTAITKSLSEEWTWDAQATLDFSRTPEGYDPESLFSVARRFHLLNDLESNKTVNLLSHLSSLEKYSAAFNEASALVVRQNHYITEMCEPVLSAALPLAQNATAQVKEFIKAESGHDKILNKAIRSLGVDPKQVQVLDCTKVLMDLFQKIAEQNFLAFSMVVDIFERTSYRSEDPFAKALQDGGAAVAATQLDAHRDINDQGDHENVAIGFLSNMQPVSEDYAVEALRLAELLTQVIHMVSKDTLAKIIATHRKPIN